MSIDLRIETRDSFAHAAATHLAQRARDAIAARGSFSIALSGGSTPWPVVDALAAMPLDWDRWRVYQVDEREAPDDDDARNWKRVRSRLLARVPIEPVHCVPMPVLDADREAAAARYAAALPPVLDVVQLGLGADGHTASLVPDDPVLEVVDRDVAWTGPYQGCRRMTLTYPAIARAHDVVWLVTGADKQPMVDRLLAADPSIPAGRVGRGVVFYAT